MNCVLRCAVGGLILFGTLCVTGAISDPLKGVLAGTNTSIPADYVPPILSNGELSMALDWTCGMRPKAGGYCRLVPGVYLAGRRHSAPHWFLFNFAKLNLRVSVDGKLCDVPDRWTQCLDVVRGEQRFEHEYGADIKVSTTVFVPLDRNAVVFRSRATNVGTKQHQVRLAISALVPGDRLLCGKWKAVGSSDLRHAEYAYSCLVDDPFGSEGLTALWCRSDRKDANTVNVSDGGLVATDGQLSPSESYSADFYVQFDNWGGPVKRIEMPKPECQAAIDNLSASGRSGFDQLQERQKRLWADYYADGFVKIPDARMQRMYDVANYHVRCDRTRWSFPVGIFPGHWNGRYFGFDEMYIHQGMLTSGHIADARRCPDFRFAILPDAERRVGHYGRNGGRDGAQWMWESVETGYTEGCPVGFWQQHYFHMPTICRTAWTQYQFSQDVEWLRERGYPVITGCARFFSKNMIYKNPDGSIYLGKCTDLERLGPSRENAFMTTVGAVYAMRTFAEASDLLCTNRMEAVEMRRLADGLMKSLPTDGDRYVGYRGCKEETVATMSGGFPFPVFTRSDKRHVTTCRHFTEKGASAGGNMYPTGKNVCPWYAGKMALSMILLGDRKEPYRWLKDAAAAIGHFGETYEINEPGLQSNPWFTTASGTLLMAVNQMLVCNAEGELWLCMGAPEAWNDYSFRLPSVGGITVSAEIASGRLARLKLLARCPAAKGKTFKVRMPGGLLGKKAEEIVQDYMAE